MGTFPVVPSPLTKPILLNKLCAHHDCLRSMWSSYFSGYRLIRAMATDLAMLRLSAPSRPRTAYNEFFFWKMKILMCCKVTPWNKQYNTAWILAFVYLRNINVEIITSIITTIITLTWLRSKKQRQFCYFSFLNENSEPTTNIPKNVPVCNFVPSNLFFLASMVFHVLR